MQQHCRRSSSDSGRTDEELRTCKAVLRKCSFASVVRPHVHSPRRSVANEIRDEPSVEATPALNAKDGAARVHKALIMRQPAAPVLLHMKPGLDEIEWLHDEPVNARPAQAHTQA